MNECGDEDVNVHPNSLPLQLGIQGVLRGLSTTVTGGASVFDDAKTKLQVGVVVRDPESPIMET